MRVKNIDIPGFSSDVTLAGRPDNNCVATIGGPNTGKTQFLTTAPEVVGIVPLDINSRFVVEKMMREGAAVVMSKTDHIRQKKSTHELKRMSDEAVKTYYREHVERVKEDISNLLAARQVKTIAIDDFGQLCQDIGFAVHGREGLKIKTMGDGKLFKDNAPNYQEITDLLALMSSKNTILTHKEKDRYGEKGTSTANEVIGKTWDNPYKPLGHKISLCLRHLTNPSYKPGSKIEDKQWLYGMQAIQIKVRPELQGYDVVLRDSLCTWDMVMALVYPEDE